MRPPSLWHIPSPYPHATGAGIVDHAAIRDDRRERVMRVVSAANEPERGPEVRRLMAFNQRRERSLVT